MGFYFRKSKSFGPFRLNLSKSGLGLSAGVKGARVSVGPRGPEIHLGRKGLYYRAKLGGTPGAGYTSTAARIPQLPSYYANLQHLTAESSYFDVCRVLGMPAHEFVTVPPEAKIPNMMLHYQGQACVFLIFANDQTGRDRFDTKYIGTKSLYPETTIHVSKPDYKILLDSYPLMGRQPTPTRPEKLPPWDGAKVILALGLCTLVGLIIATALIVEWANEVDRQNAKPSPSPTRLVIPLPTATPLKTRSSHR